MDKILYIFKDPELRKKIFFVLGTLLIFRLAAVLPIPGVDTLRLKAFFEGNQFFGLLNIFSGGALDNLSVVMLGVGPYITASIIMQLLTMLIPRLKEIYHEEGEAGRQKFNQYSRLLTVPLAVVQGFGLLVLLERQGILGALSFPERMVNIAVVAAGSIFLMWLGEAFSEYGIGNGISILIFAGIVSSIPSAIQQTLFTFEPSQLPLYLGFLIAGIIIVAGAVIVAAGERAHRARGGNPRRKRGFL